MKGQRSAAPHLKANSANHDTESLSTPKAPSHDDVAYRLKRMLERMEAEFGAVPEEVQRRVDALD